jgi:uncharacterized protein YkwD
MAIHRAALGWIALPALALAACSGDWPQRVGAQPSWRGATPATTAGRARAAVGPIRFAPAGNGATRYNDSVAEPPATALEAAALAAVGQAATRAGLPVPVRDARLSRACSQLAEVVPEQGVVGYSLVEFALQHNGIIEPSPHLLVIWGNVASPELVVEELRPRLAEILGEGATARLGIGGATRNRDGTGAVVFALQGSGVSTAAIPRWVGPGATIAIDAMVDPRYRDPEVFVTHDDGATEQLELSAGRSGGFSAQVPCGTRIGRQQIEITASDAAGATVLANFPVWCAAEPPRTLTVQPGADDESATSPEDAERRLFGRLNRDRRAAGLAELGWDDQLAGVARAHSEEMHRTHIVAHISPTTGSAADRVRAAHIKTGVVLENVARAYSLEEAHTGLMNSPGHRANLMTTVATNVGIGIAFGDEVSGRRELFISQVFTRLPPLLEPVRAVETVREKLAAARQSLVVVPELRGLAQQAASALAAGSTEGARELIVRRAGRQARVALRVASIVTADLDTLDAASLIGDSAASEIGIGVAQGSHPEIGERAIWIVVIFAEPAP